MSIHRMLVSFAAEFVSGKMIGFAVGDCRGCVGVGGKVMKFRNSFVRALGHEILLPCSMQSSGAGSGERFPEHSNSAYGPR
jgi:hypothetical protein